MVVDENRRSYTNRWRNFEQAFITSVAFRIADTTPMRFAPAAKTSSSVRKFMPPMANHGMVTFAAAHGHIPASPVLPSVSCPSHRPARWRCNPVRPASARFACSGECVERPIWSWIWRLGSGRRACVRRRRNPPAQVAEFRAGLSRDIQMVVDDQADICPPSNGQNGLRHPGITSGVTFWRGAGSNPRRRRKAVAQKLPARGHGSRPCQ